MTTTTEVPEPTPEQELEQRIYKAFRGDNPRCDCCRERHPKCRWRPAYQMMLCPNCPPSGLPKRKV